MTDRKIIAQRRTDYGRFYLVIIAFLACAVFMVVMYFTNSEEPDAYIWLILAAVFAAAAAIFMIFLVRAKRLPDVLIYLEGGALHFYNGCECRPEDIYDIASAYDSDRYTTLNSGKITIYTGRGKIVCRGIKDLAYTTTAVISLKYGRVYTTDELKAKMNSRAAAKSFISQQ